MQDNKFIIDFNKCTIRINPHNPEVIKQYEEITKKFASMNRDGRLNNSLSPEFLRALLITQIKHADTIKKLGDK